MLPSLRGAGLACSLSFLYWSAWSATAGQLDESFDPGSGANGAIRSVLPLANGKLIVAGDFTSWSGTPVHHLVQLDETGAVDGSFVAPADPAFLPNRLWLGRDGKILVGGDLNLGASGQRGLVRLNPLGSLDETFNARLDAEPKEVLVLPDGSLYVAGTMSQAGSFAIPGWARLKASGELDPTYSLPVVNSLVQVRSAVLMKDGGPLVSGLEVAGGDSRLLGLVRFLPDGTLDPQFCLNGGGLSIGVFSRSFATLPDGGIVVGGVFELSRLTPEGYLVPGFASHGIPGLAPDYVVGSPDDRILAGVAAGVSVGGELQGLVRLQANGELDPSFRVRITRSGFAGPVVPTSVRVTDSGDIYVAGNFDQVDGVIRAGLARLHASTAARPSGPYWSAGQASFARAAGALTLTVVREGDLSVPASVDYQTVDGTAQGGADYTAAGGTLRFAPGELARQVKFDRLAPNSTLGDRRFSVVLTNALLLSQVVTFSNVLQELDLVTLTNQVVETNEIVVTEVITVTNEVTTTIETVVTNGVTLTNLVSLTNTVSLTNLLVVTNAISLTNQIAVTNHTIVTNLVAVTNEVPQADPSVWAVGSPASIQVQLIEERSRVEFQTEELTVSETGETVRLGVTRTNALGTSAAIRWRVSGAAGELSPTEGVAVFGPGEGFYSFEFKLVDDAVVNGTRTNRLELFAGSFRSSVGSQDNVSVAILDNDYPGFGGDAFKVPVKQFLPVGPGKTLALGRFSTVHGVPQANAAWLRNDGRVANVPRPDVGPVDGAARHLVGSVGSAGAYYLAGDLAGGVAGLERIVRYGADSVIDSSFAAEVVPPGLLSVFSLPDGGVILAGNSPFFNGARAGVGDLVGRGMFRRLRADGSADASFETQTSLAYAPTVVGLPDGRILVNGVRVYSDPAAPERVVDPLPQVGGLVQFLPNGQVDPSFRVTFSASTDLFGNAGGVRFLSTFWRQADGRWVVLGSFNAVNGVAGAGLARLTDAGQVDGTFPSVTPASGTVFHAGVPLPSGGFVAVISRVGQAGGPLLQWYDATGRPDLRFSSHTVATADPQSLVVSVLSDGTVFLGGSLSGVDGLSRYQFAYFPPGGRLGTDGPLDSVPFAGVPSGLPGIEFIARSTGVGYVLEHSADLSNWTAEPPVSLTPGLQRFSLDPTAGARGFLRVRWAP